MVSVTQGQPRYSVINSLGFESSLWNILIASIVLAVSIPNISLDCSRILKNILHANEADFESQCILPKLILTIPTDPKNINAKHIPNLYYLKFQIQIIDNSEVHPTSNHFQRWEKNFLIFHKAVKNRYASQESGHLGVPHW